MVSKLLILSLFFFVGFSYAELNKNKFPDGFTLGVATAAFQIEGAWNESGKGEQIWDWFMHTYPAKIDNKDNGDVACDSYHKWQEDINLLKDLNVNHYRLSIMWTRILPDGFADNYTINKAGVEYYRKILQALKNAKITPYVTLYHWDLPILLHQEGGWMNPIIADHFAEYARICFEKFGDLVKNWITLNEPSTYCVLGYGTGMHAPGYILPEEGVYKCAYTSALAHAKAYRIYEKEFKKEQKGRVSIVLNSGWAEPKSDTEKNKKAADREMAFDLGLYADPIYKGDWPQTVIEIVDQRSQLQGLTTSRLPKFTDEEKALINGTSDFFALNTYATYLVEHTNSVDELVDDISFITDKGTNATFDPSWTSEVDWVALVPEGFRKLLNYVSDTYGNPEIIVTENGWADKNGTTTDDDRKTYIQQYLSALLDAHFSDNVNVTGYTVWSLLDNLEWSHGYTQKLGLTQVDFKSSNRTRTPKTSYTWYKNVIKTRCIYDDPKSCSQS